MCTRTQGKGAVTPKGSEPELLVSVCESLVEVWVNSDLLWDWGHWIQQSWEQLHADICLFEGGPHYCITLTLPLAWGQTTGREHSPTHQQKIVLKIYWVLPCLPEQEPHLVPPIRKIPQASYPHPSEGRQNESQNDRRLTRLFTWITALSNSWNYEPRHICQGYIFVPCLFNLYAEYIMWNARLDEAQAEIKVAGRNINDLRYADDTTLMAESKELKSLLIKVKEESEKVGVKLSIQKTKIMASCPIILWQIDGETMETDRLYFLRLQYHCRWWLQPWN